MVQTGSFVPMIVNILVAEDNPVNQEVIYEMLISIGCQVQVVSNGQEVLDALSHESYDMIFMDCQMPVMDGYEAAQRIRLLESRMGWKYIPIIGITGRIVPDNYEKSEKACMDDFLNKPFTFEQLKNTIFRWTGVHLEDGIGEHGKAKISNESFAVPVSTVSNMDCLDLKALENISKIEKGSNELLKKIVAIFIKNTPGLIAEIQKGIQEKNSEKIFQAAHSLKSTSANVGAMTISNICGQLESNSRMNMIDDAASQIALIESEYVMVLNALNGFIGNLNQV
jgi:two-component system, sensor histidine kinase and response regulator